MAGEDEQDPRTLPYVLCGFTGAGVMFNLILLVWHVVKFKPHKASVFVKYALIFLDLWYMGVGVALSLLILYKDLGSDWLCKFGGFLILFTIQESFWTLAVTCVTVLLWKHSQEPPRARHHRSSHHQKWKKPLFVLSMVLKCVLLALVSLLPIVNLSFFDSKSDFYYLCTPLRLPGEHGWPYSTALLALDWVAVIIAVACITLSIIISRRRAKNGKTLDLVSTTSSISSARTLTEREVAQYTLRQHVVLPFSAAAWLLTLLLTSISYFSGGGVMSSDTVQWLLGFCIAGTIVLHPVITFIVVLASHSHWLLPKAAACAKCGFCGGGQKRGGAGHAGGYLPGHHYSSACPKNLVSLAKLPPTSPQLGKYRSHYLVQWRDSKSALQAGVMKVYAPSALHKWRNEVNALSKTSFQPHPNVAEYHWEMPHNNFTAAICTFTRQVVSPESSLTCRANFPHGTLQQYLQAKVNQLTEVALHKVTVDVASGLDHLHQLHLVHNGLTTHTIYMASIPETGGVKAVIGDFENSYEVPVDPLHQSRLSLLAKEKGRRGSKSKYPHPLWTISSEIDRDNGKFAPDIRSFGLIVLEMLMSMSEYNKQVFNKRKRISRSLDDLLKIDNHSEDRSEVKGACHGLDLQFNESCKDCKCSSKVKDIRACADKPDSDIQLFSNFMDILSDNQKDKPSKADHGSDKLSSPWQGSAFASSLHNHNHTTSLPDELKVHTPTQESRIEASRPGSIQLRALPPVPAKPHSAHSSHNTSKESNVTAESTFTDTADTSDSNSKSLAQRRKKAHLSHMNRTLRQMTTEDQSDEELDVEIPIYNDDFAGSEYTNPCNVYMDVKDSNTDLAKPKGDTSKDPVGDLKAKAKRPSCIPCEVVQSGSSEDNSPATPSSEDIYNTSLASLASFETIYEDEESPTVEKAVSSKKPSAMPITRIAHQRRFQRVHPVRKKAEDARPQHKRMSTSSLDGSIGSGDSGFGSSNHCDLLSTCSEVNQLFKSGTRDTVYAENAGSASDSDSYSLVRHYLDGRTPKHTDSGIESNAESSEELGRHSRVVSMSSPDEAISSPGDFPDLRLMKQPCTKRHPHPCTHPHPFMHPSRSMSSCGTHGHDGHDHQGSTTLTSERPSSEGEEVIYAKVSPRCRRRDTEGRDCDKECQFCNRDPHDQHIHIQDSIHPAIKNQYMLKSASHQPLPKLGVSAVHSARRMSAMSSTCSSVTSGSTETLDSIFRSSDRKLTIGDISELTKSQSQQQQYEMRQRPVSDLPQCYSDMADHKHSFKDTKGAARSIDATPHSSSSLSSPAPSDTRAQSTLSHTSFTSSIADLINDSDLIIKGIMEKENQFFATNQRQSSQLRERPRSGLGMQQMNQFRHVVRRNQRGHPQGAAAGGAGPMKDVIEGLREKGNLGFIAQQMMPLLSDCWLQDPAPSTEQILKRLEHVLPTASV